MWPWRGESPPLAEARTTPFAYSVHGLLSRTVDAVVPTDATCPWQTCVPVFWLTATIEPSCWPTKTIPSPTEMSLAAFADEPRQNTPGPPKHGAWRGAVPMNVHFVLPVFASSAATPTGLWT